MDRTSDIKEAEHLSDYAQIGILLYDVEADCFIKANSYALDMLGYKESDLSQLGLKHLQPDIATKNLSSKLTPKNVTQTHVDQVVQGASFFYECDFKQPSGHIVPFEVRLSGLFSKQNKKLIRVGLTDISERKKAIDGLKILTESTINDLDVFLESCVKNLVEVYGAKFAFVGLLMDGKDERIATRVVCVNKQIVDNFEYDLVGTPCADVLENTKQLIPENVVNIYPEDHMLKDMRVESYYGAPLIDSNGKKLGLVSVMDVKPMALNSWTEVILGVFSKRIAFEFEHFIAQKKIQTSETEIITILKNMQDTFYRTDTAGNIVMVSNAVKQLLGYEQDELFGSKMSMLYFDAAGRDKFLKALQESNGGITNYVAALKRKDGSAVWVSTNAHYYHNDAGEVMGVEGTTRDITSLRLAEEQMRKLSMALEQSADLVLITDSDGYIEYVNRSFERLTGFEKAEMLGMQNNFGMFCRQSERYIRSMWEVLNKGDVFNDVLMNERKDGSAFYEQKTITPLKDETGKISHFVATGKDISERMQAQEKLQYMAHHDPLTELPNRILFLERLDLALARARWNKRVVAVLLLDLDRFKTINETLGHDIGDGLLKLVSQRLESNIREGDTVARLGGDEFAILMDDIASANDIENLAKKLLGSLEPKFEVEYREFYITSSIGVSHYPGDGQDSKTLLRNADIAMYRAKELGKNNYQFYSTEMTTKAFERLTLESSLRHALEHNEFVLHYQPQVYGKSCKLFGVEALIRWQHPELGMISPLSFIPLLEETGQILQVGEWVLRTACEQAVRWSDAKIKGNLGQPIRISVNLSSRQFNDPNFVVMVKQIIQETGIKPELLELEITESILMRNTTSTIEAINTLSNMGIHFAIDDFGTGYSSLSYLRRFPINTIKIDRSFIRDINHDSDDAAIAKAIIVMALSMKMQVIAEGVESKQQLDFLLKNQCELIQGFLFSKPLAGDALLDWVNDKEK